LRCGYAEDQLDRTQRKNEKVLKMVEEKTISDGYN